MTKKSSTWLHQLTNNPQLVFGLDALGALLTAFMVGVVLVQLQTYIGMPASVLRMLAIPALFFAAYSTSCYFGLKNNWRPFLMGIVVANLLYCCVSLGMMIYHYADLTTLGIIYFSVEIVVVFLVVGIEIKTIANLKPTN